MAARKRKNPSAEMPFLDHLEELRWRILWSLAALLAFSAVGFVLVQRYDVLALLKEPIAAYLPEGKLFVTRPTDAFLITLKLALVVGILLATPVIVGQAWKFLSPALYEHERRYIVPILIAGLGLFVAGAVLAYLWVLPAILKILFSFQYADLEFIITADAYFGFAAKTIIAFGMLFELPLVMVLLAALGLVDPKTFARQRPIALVVGSVVAALLTPPDALTLVMMLVPTMALYELGIVVARLVGNRRARRGVGAGVVFAVAALGASDARAQEPAEPPPADTTMVRMAPPAAPDTVARADTTAVLPDALVPIDTALARQLGLPAGPSRQFAAPDSMLDVLLSRPGYVVTRYAGDSITLLGATREVQLRGRALVERAGTIVEADSVTFRQAECRLFAQGDPALFDGSTVLIGDDMRYDTCLHRGTVVKALTSFNQSGVEWFLRGALEVDSASTRIYGASNDMTSCDLPTPHYTFAAHNVKWVSNSILVARPAVLYVRDVPVLWLPFIFQDMRQGRRSGILVPRMGVNDLVRPNAGYRRHISNVGFYLALSDYFDFQASLDWFAGNYVAANGRVQYRWLNQFLSGSFGVSQIFESGEEGGPGARSMRVQWGHQQSFNQRTRLSASVDYATSSRVVERNSVDPFVQTATLSSRVNFSKQYDWGTFNLGVSRSQDLSNDAVNQTLPNFSLTPVPIDLGSSITWSPTFSFTNSQAFNQGPGVVVELPPMGGVLQADTLLSESRNTSLSLATPLRIGRWNWRNTLQVTDFRSQRPQAPVVIVDPDNPADTTLLYFSEDFRTELDWNTGINLPTLFPSTWKLQPTVGIRNVTGGAFLLRNRFTDGRFVAQGKRVSFGAGLSPTLFGFLPGVGPVTRVRHALSPIVSWSYAPSASVPEAYARAQDPSGSAARESPALHSISFGLSQTFEGKLRRAEGDTTDATPQRKVKLLSVQTSSVSYDFEQAKEEGRNGWRTQTLTNRLTSDLLPGFTLSLTHDLWDGPVGFDDTDFSPALTSVSARFSLSSRTFQRIVGLLAGGAAPVEVGEPSVADEPFDFQDGITPAGTGLGPRPGLDPTFDRMTSGRRRGGGLEASFTYDDRRSRTGGNANRTLGMSFRFSPSSRWSASWTTQYNFTLGEFGQNALRLDRELHRWQATFAFIRSPNGNVAFNFFINLRDQPDIKFQWDQRTVGQGR